MPQVEENGSLAELEEGMQVIAECDSGSPGEARRYGDSLAGMESERCREGSGQPLGGEEMEEPGHAVEQSMVADYKAEEPEVALEADLPVVETQRESTVAERKSRQPEEPEIDSEEDMAVEDRLAGLEAAATEVEVSVTLCCKPEDLDAEEKPAGSAIAGCKMARVEHDSADSEPQEVEECISLGYTSEDYMSEGCMFADYTSADCRFEDYKLPAGLDM